VSSEPDILPMRGTFPTPPKHLNSAGKQAWKIGSVLWAEGTLKERDLLNWTLFCEAVQEKSHCEALIKKQGEYQVSRNGFLAEHPAIKRRQHIEHVIRKYSMLFGLLPEARKKRPAVSQSVAQRPK
jgi:P27 family predicted phage terminase small subunit